MTKTIRVRAVADRKCPAVSADGRALMGRYAGRAADGSALDAQDVPDCSYIRRAISRGDLELIVEEVPS